MVSAGSKSEQQLTSVFAVGQPAPEFELERAFHDGSIDRCALDAYRGRWLMLVFYPRDFSFVCPTELIALSARIGEFEKLDCQVLALSIDSIESHLKWFQVSTDDGGIGPLQFPLGSDPDGVIARQYQVWNEKTALPNRGLFLIDPEGVVQFSLIHSASVGRNVDEVIRVLQALQTGGLCPTSWTSADGVLNVERLLKAGRVIGHFRIEKPLGQGAFGNVLLAQDIRLDRRVALKILRHNIGETETPILREAQAAANINHENVCTVHSVETVDGLPIIVMEYVEGKNLSAYTHEERQAIGIERIISGLVSGLAAAHRMNVVHRDLKPANIILNQNMQPVIVDFGLSSMERQSRQKEEVTGNRSPFPSALMSEDAGAGLVDLEQTVNLPLNRLANQAEQSTERMLSGTPNYMAPERFHGVPSSFESDVFALGLIMFEVLIGKKALNAASLLELTRLVCQKTLADDLSRQVPLKYRGIVSAALAQQPGDRPSADEILDAISGA